MKSRDDSPFENVTTNFSYSSYEENTPIVSHPQVTLLKQLEEDAWDAPAQHLIWPGIELNKALGSWDEGMLFITALENLGKSSYVVQTVCSLLELNSDLSILDISLDDSFRERTRRYLGCIAGVDTQVIARPVQATPQQKRLRKNAYEQMIGWINSGKLEIKTQAEDEFSHPHKINDYIKEFCAQRPDTKVLVIVDSWHDIIMPEVQGDESEKHVLQSLSRTLKAAGALCIMTAHRRKSSTSDFSRKSSNDELKGSAFIKHLAKVMFTLHNEVKVRRENAEIKWTDKMGNTLPVLEISVQKNKTCDYDGWIFYYFQPATGRSVEVDAATSFNFREIVTESLRSQRSNYTQR